MNPSVVCLASGSPRRAELLGQIGVPFEVCPADIDETPQSGEAPADFVRRMAREKARAVASKRLAVLAADTVVVVDETILGKPANENDALGMLKKLSGRTHSVLTAVTVRAAARDRSCLCESRVRMRVIEEHEMHAYWLSGEPRDKAGAYAIQGLGAVFIEDLKGSYSGVVGLPLAPTATLLEKSGVTLWYEAGRT